MPRQPRLIPPNQLVHIISRFANSEYRFGGDVERREYLRRLGIVAERTDWQFLHFAAMSTHTHILGISGELPLSSFAHGLNTGISGWLNKTQGRHGPVFSQRPTTIICTERTAPYVVAYLSNNPPRGGVVELARQSTWTSHGCYLEPRTAPPWLHVERGLELAGFGTRAAERQRFDEFVNSLRHEPRNDALNGRNLQRVRRELRREVGAPVELAPPLVDIGPTGTTVSTPLVASSVPPLSPTIAIGPERVTLLVAMHTGVSVEALRSPRRERRVANGRRLALLVWVDYLGCPAAPMACHLGLSIGGASALLRRRPAALLDLKPIAARITKRLVGAS